MDSSKINEISKEDQWKQPCGWDMPSYFLFSQKQTKNKPNQTVTIIVSKFTPLNCLLLSVLFWIRKVFRKVFFEPLPVDLKTVTKWIMLRSSWVGSQDSGSTEFLLDYTGFYLGLWDSLCNLLSTTMKSRIIPWYDTVLSFPFAPQMCIMTAVVFFLRFFLVFIILSIGSFLQKIPSFVQMSI